MSNGQCLRCPCNMLDAQSASHTQRDCCTEAIPDQDDLQRLRPGEQLDAECAALQRASHMAAYAPRQADKQPQLAHLTLKVSDAVTVAPMPECHTALRMAGQQVYPSTIEFGGHATCTRPVQALASCRAPCEPLPDADGRKVASSASVCSSKATVASRPTFGSGMDAELSDCMPGAKILTILPSAVAAALFGSNKPEATDMIFQM